jgi:hypothetical protein
VANEKKNGMTLPTGIFQATEQGAAAAAVESDAPDDSSAKARAGKKRRVDKPATAGIDRDGWKLYLSEDVRFRLRMLAFKRGQKLSAVANEVLDKALPRWNLERTD